MRDMTHLSSTHAHSFKPEKRGKLREIEKYTQFVYYGINMIRIIPVKDLVQRGSVYHSDW